MNKKQRSIMWASLAVLALGGFVGAHVAYADEAPVVAVSVPLETALPSVEVVPEIAVPASEGLVEVLSPPNPAFGVILAEEGADMGRCDMLMDKETIKDRAFVDRVYESATRWGCKFINLIPHMPG